MNYTVDQILAMKKPPKKKLLEPEKPKAEVIPLPTGAALALAKQDRTKAEDISRAMRAKTPEEIEEMRERRLAEEARRRNEQYLSSQAYIEAGERFNADYYKSQRDALKDREW